MADISGLLSQIDGALGAKAPPLGSIGGTTLYPTSPGTDSTGAPAPLDTDVIVRTPPAPRIVQGVAPAPDPNATASPLASAIYAGGQAPSAATAQPTADAAPQKSTAQQTIDAIDAALSTPNKQSAPAQQSQKPNIYQAIASPAIGFNEALADTVGAPVDLVNAGMGAIGLPTSQTPVGGSQSIKNALGVIGANPDTHPANSTIERIGRGAGAGAASMLLPAAGVGALSEAGALTPSVASTLGEALGAPATAGQAASLSAIGGAAGGTGQAASEVAPAPLKPYADIAGNILGGGAAAGLGAGVGLLGSGAGTAKDFLAPLTAAGRQRMADQRLAKGATSPVAALDAIDNAPRELVPGSEPTMFQLTGDRGLGQMERQAAKKAPAEFLGRAAEQNAKRVAAIRAAAPNGDPQAVSAALRAHLAALDDMAGTVESGIKRNAAESEAATREAAARAEANARGTAQARGSAVGGHGTPEAYGSALREQLQGAKDAAKAHERALWEAVDPDGKLVLDGSPIGSAARKTIADISPYKKPMTAEEAHAFRAAMTMKGEARFSHVTDLRTQVNDLMRNELKDNGETMTYARLARLRGAIEEAINSAVERKAGQEQAEVAAGRMSPEDTMAANLKAEVDAYRSAKAEAAGTYSGRSDTGTARGGSSGLPGSNGAEISGGREFASPPRDQGVPGTEPFDQAARDRLAAATEATKRRVATFGSDPIGKILQTQGTKGAYRIADSALGEKLFPSGPGGAEAVQKFMAAAGNNAASQAQLRDLAAASLRRFAGENDGSLNPGKTAAWIRGHRDALRAVPGLADRFIDGARGSAAIDDVTAANKAAIKDVVQRGTAAIEEAATARRQSIDEYQKGLVGKLIGSDNAVDTTRMIGSIFGRPDSVALMRRVATETRGNPDAEEGLKKAIIDHISDNFLGDKTEDGQTVKVIKGEPLKRFVSKNLGPLSQVFKPQEVAGIRAVADDLARSDQSLRTKLPGQSNTAQDTAGEEKEHSSLGVLTEAIVGGSEAAHHFGVVGFLGGAGAAIGKALLNVARQAGLRTVDDIVREMLLHPDLARAGLMRAANAKDVEKNALTFAQKMRRVSVFAPTLAEAIATDKQQR